MAVRVVADMLAPFDCPDHEPDPQLARELLWAALPEILRDLAREYMAENADVNQTTGATVATQEQWRFFHWLSLRAATLETP